MNILIVDGNERDASERYTNMGMDTQYEVYQKALENLSTNKLNITVVHPAIKDEYLPIGISLDDFDGIAWTCLLYTSPSPRDATLSRMPSSA